jgi:hypothetical protein
MELQEYSTESSLLLALASPIPVTNQRLFFIPRERMSEDKPMQHQYREKMLRNRIERVTKHPDKKEYRKELHKREDTLKNTTAFLQELASEENRSKGLSLESRDGYINRLRQLKYSKRRRPKSKPTKAAGGFGEPAKDIVSAIRKSQRSTGGRPADERRYSIAKREPSGLSYGVEANRAIVKRWVVYQTLKIRSLGA